MDDSDYRAHHFATWEGIKDAGMTTTQQIIEMVASRIGHPVYNPVSNRSLAPILGMSHTHIGRLRDGDGVMARDAFVRACHFLELPPEEIVSLTLALDADGSEDEGMRAYIRGVVSKLRPDVVKSSAGILLAAFIGFAQPGDAFALEKPVNPNGPAPDASSEECILCEVASRIRRAVRRFGRLFPVPPLLPGEMAMA